MLKKLLAIALFVVITHAQAFLVTDFSGERVELLDAAEDGRWMLVALWQLECVSCEQHKPFVERFHNKYKSSKAHVVGLVTDGHEWMPAIEQFVQANPTAFPNYIVFGDVFKDQIKKATGKEFHTSPGYLIYKPDGELYAAINSTVNIDQLLAHLEEKIMSQ